MELNFTVENPLEWNTGSVHEISFNFPFAVFEKKTKKRVEKLHIMRRNKSWGLQSLLYMKSMAEIEASPQMTYLRSKSDSAWTGCKMSQMEGNKLEVTGCVRQFEQPGFKRDWDIENKNPVIIEYRDKYFDLRGKFRQIDLILDSGYDKGLAEKMKKAAKKRARQAKRTKMLMGELY